MSYKNPLHRRANIHRVRFDTIDQRRIEQMAIRTRRQQATLLHDLSVLALELLEKHDGDFDSIARAS
ncbi:MAG: hypothetical protein ABW154_14220 [Dyella sp.]